MKITQLHELVTQATSETLGSESVLAEDLSNLVDIGNEIIDGDKVDSYVKKLVNHIGKVIFVNRLYSGGAPSVMMDAWEYGSIVEKISVEMPDATENQSHKLVNGTEYSPNVFHEPVVSVKFFNSLTTFEVEMSFTEKQIKQSFSNSSQLNGFISMVVTSIENSMTVKIDSLIMRTINHMIAETIESSKEGGVVGGVRVVNLLTEFNKGKASTKQLTSTDAMKDSSFLKHATYQMGLYSDRMGKISTLFNGGGKARFTPKDKLHTILLSDFAKSSKTYLVADIENVENVTLPTHDTVPYWQGSGTDYSFGEVSKINVKVNGGSGQTIQSDIIGVMFDREALGVSNLDRRVTTNYNPKGEFYNNFYKFDAGFYNDQNENFVVFLVA